MRILDRQGEKEKEMAILVLIVVMVLGRLIVGLVDRELRTSLKNFPAWNAQIHRVAYMLWGMAIYKAMHMAGLAF